MKSENWGAWLTGLFAGLAIASILALFGVTFWGLLSVTMAVLLGVLVVSNLPSKNEETGKPRDSPKPQPTHAIETGESGEDVEDFYLEEMKEILGPLLGPAATSEDVRSTIEDLRGIPSEARAIVGQYGGLLVRLGEERERRLLVPLSILPRPKEKIKSALTEALQVAKNEKLRSDLEIGLDRLDDFIPDDYVPQDPKENRELWYKRRMENEKFRAMAHKHLFGRLEHTFETLSKNDIGRAWLFDFDLDFHRQMATSSPEWAAGVGAYDAAEHVGCSLAARLVNLKAGECHGRGMAEDVAESELYARNPEIRTYVEEKIAELKAAGVWPWTTERRSDPLGTP